jgi:putative oxidoreductase
VTNGVLLAGRLILAVSFLPEAVARAVNVSGFGLQLWMKGMPYPTAAASGVVVAELIGPVALVLGLAPRFTASILIATTVVTTGILHRFWDMAGVARQAEQALFLAHVGLVAGLLFYAVAGPGAWSWQALWRRNAAKPKAAARKKPRAKPGVSRPPKVQDELAEAA